MPKDREHRFPRAKNPDLRRHAATSFEAFPSGLGAVANDTWYHMALSREGTSMRWFVDGDLKDTQTVSTDINPSTDGLRIGAPNYTSGEYINGWIEEFRFSKGVARYTANFTPPTAAYG